MRITPPVEVLHNSGIIVFGTGHRVVPAKRVDGAYNSAMFYEYIHDGDKLLYVIGSSRYVANVIKANRGRGTCRYY